MDWLMMNVCIPILVIMGTAVCVLLFVGIIRDWWRNGWW